MIITTHLHKYFGYCDKKLKEYEFSEFFFDSKLYITREGRVRNSIDNIPLKRGIQMVCFKFVVMRCILNAISKDRRDFYE